MDPGLRREPIVYAGFSGNNAIGKTRFNLTDGFLTMATSRS
jgi:hypothetical protein